MTWKIHHVNIPAPNVRESAEFYSSVFGMTETEMPVKSGPRGSFRSDRSSLAWFEGDNAQIHVCQPSATMARDNGFYINPVLNGHLAIQVDDIAEVKRRLDERGDYYADPGHWAMANHYQIYLHDPAMNVIEIIQPLPS